ncbi:MAG: hypothetical protein M1840_000669 [Geoglossum simile]|nr:MAG: hypothetical protein M1840_000669 [Geoglossum simile]
MSSYVSPPAPPPANTDYFHVPYPPSPLDLLPPCPSTDATEAVIDPFNWLPQEVCDQIFSLLSAPALDAARYVSRAWYRRIMTNTWVLRQVLELDSYARLGDVCFEPYKDDDKRAKALRCLAKELDVRSRLTSAGDGDEAWRVRYRRCDITFSNPGHQPCAGGDEEGSSGAQSGSGRITFAEISSSGSLVTFIYNGASTRTGDSENGYSVLFYYIDSNGKPKLVKPISCSPCNGIPVNVDLSEGGHAGPWFAEVAFSGQKAKQLLRSPQLGQSGVGPTTFPDKGSASKNLAIAPASLRDIQRYCSTCCDYHKTSVNNGLIVKRVTETRGKADIHPHDDWVHVETCNCNEDWLILENLPVRKKGTERPYYLAKHEQTGNLFIVRLGKCAIDGDCTESEPDGGFQNLQGLLPIMLLVRPHQRTSYANIAVAPGIMFRAGYLWNEVLRIAVLWYEADCPATGKVGLYIYDVVNLRTVACDGLGGRRIGAGGNWSPRMPPPPQAVPFEYTPAEHLPIDSNPQRTIKLKGRVSGRRVCGFDRGMGGLHSSLLPPRKPLGGSIRLLGDGPTGMRLTILEFGHSWHREEFWELSISEKWLSNSAVSNCGCCNDRRCACAYHDFGYLVAFPDPGSLQSSLATEKLAMKRKLPLWPFPRATPPAGRPNTLPVPGHITAFRRYADVLAERKEESDARRKAEMEKSKRDERALTEASRDLERNRLQGVNQITPLYTLWGLCGLRWKGLFRS